MNALGPLILLVFGFSLLLAARVVILLVLRKNERPGSRRLAADKQPTVISADLFAIPSSKTPS